MSALQQIKAAGNDLTLGETKTIVCPFCAEDWELQRRPITWRPERSCSITRDKTGLLYHCFRASCSSGSGFLGTIFVDTNAAKHVKKFTPKEYPYETRFPEGDDLKYLERFEFDYNTCEEYGIKYNPYRHSYVFDIRDWRGYTTGVVDRDFFGNRDVKSISYWFNDIEKLYFTPVRGDTALIVEDIPSAIKADRFLPSIALLGTGLNDSQVNLIRTLYSNIIIALDADAITKAVHYQKKYGIYFESIRVLPLKRDIKDTSYYKLNEIFYLTLGER